MDRLEGRALETHRAFRFRLYPSAEQETQFRQYAGVVRLVYNLALEQRCHHWRAYKRAHGKTISMPGQCRELTELRSSFAFIGAVNRSCQEQALRDLESSFSRFFLGQSGFPRPRKKGVNDAFRFKGRDVWVERLNRNWGRVKLPGIGVVRFVWTRRLEGRVSNATISRDALGWHVSFACAFEHGALASPRTNSVGIDRGIVHTLALSNGSFADMPMEQLRLLDRRARKQAQALSRSGRGSNRGSKTRIRLAATRAKAARIRKHFNHVQSRRIAEAFGTVVAEDLKTANMTRSAKGTAEQPGVSVAAKSGLNRAILDRGWHQFEAFLAYKLEANGGELIKVLAAYTSQTCSACGSISKHHRKSQAVFQCSDCGHSANADTNAAINILRAGTRPADANDEVAHVVRESRRAA